ncbi:hypothetical protein [Sulfurimonas sp.]|uniref:hypothetical protein n=1 Tax=Sulfurimonas sp. TaxID=2022749 RepID=UPI002B479621|nr:hypothetical protein [Sulfurimonas sp.]
MKNIQWQPISNSLKEIYQEQNILHHFEEDEIYLKNAFEVTEKLWDEQFNKIDKLKIIMISESPLFGDIQRYIYNPNTPASVFFHFKDLEAFLEDGQTIKKPKLVQEQKNIMFECFHKNGFITLDIFPLALNPKHTKIHYRKMSKKLYHQLLKVTAEDYLMPKLKLCLAKSNEHTHYVYRYKRLFDKTENHFENVLNIISSKDTKYKIDTINGTNMSLDRNKLRELLKA